MLVDLTHPITPEAYAPPGSPPLEQRRLTDHAESGVQDTWIGMPVHAATHVDAPLHAIADGDDIASVDLGQLVGPAVGWWFACDGPREIALAEVRGALPRARPGDAVLIGTGWDRFYPTPGRYGLHPHLAADAAAWLADQGVRLVGVDTPTPELAVPLRESEFDYPVHTTLLARRVLIVENLARLERVAGRRFRLIALPLPIAASDGAPARVVAELH